MNDAKLNLANYHLFSDKYEYSGEYEGVTRITLTQYNSTILDSKVLSREQDGNKNLLRNDCINWFQIMGLTDSGRIGKFLKNFDIADVDLKAILTPCHAARIEECSGRLLIVMNSCMMNQHGKVCSEHICILAKGNIVFTFREVNKPTFKNVFDRLKANTMRVRDSNRSVLVALILNSIFSDMINTAVSVEEMLEEIDDILLDENQCKKQMGKKIQNCRHANLIIQKNSFPLKDEFKKLLNADLIKKDEKLLLIYNELYDQKDFIVLTANNCKEILASLRDLYVSNNDLRTNSIMKRLTVVSTLFIPITFIVGLWGMNFRLMPELEWKYGYLVAWLILLVTGFGTYIYMKKNRWFN